MVYFKVWICTKRNTTRFTISTSFFPLFFFFFQFLPLIYCCRLYKFLILSSLFPKSFIVIKNCNSASLTQVGWYSGSSSSSSKSDSDNSDKESNAKISITSCKSSAFDESKFHMPECNIVKHSKKIASKRSE